MTGGAPFIYDRPQSWNFGNPTNRGFNPRAATQASWAPRTPPTQKKDGPLVDFNRHPDSYLIVPYGNLNVQPMHPNTKSNVDRARKFQLLLRVLSLIGALGLFFCMIAINHTSTSAGWIIRVAPAVALCHTVYSIYHLCRTAEGRTPASTASYMMFAAMVDTGLLPFFAFSAYLSYNDYSRNAYGWSTILNDSDLSYKVIYAFFIMNATVGGLLLVSLFMDVYLATIFRKIAKLPPDMNPLEPNLTSRHGHKRNKSSMNITEKQMSSSTLANNRNLGISGKRIPYMHTRTDSADSVTLYGNDSARNSRAELRKDFDEAQHDPYRLSKASSRQTLAPTRPNSAVPPSNNARQPGTGLEYRPQRSSNLVQENSRPSSWLSYLDYEGQPTEISDVANQQLDQEVRPLSPVSAISSRGPSMDQPRNERENWYARNTDYEMVANNISTHDMATETVSSNDLQSDYLVPPLFPQQKKRSRDPLGMNPPTPVPDYQDENNSEYPAALYGSAMGPGHGQRPALTPADGNRRTSRPSSFIGSGGKSRFYGNLRASIGGADKKPADSNVVEIYPDSDSDEYERTKTMHSDYSGNIEVYGSSDDGNDDPVAAYHAAQVSTYSPQRVDHQSWRGHGVGNGMRQTSNSTGHDLHAGYAGLGSEFGRGMARRREVSGKVAEEGRSPGFDEVGRRPAYDEVVVPQQGSSYRIPQAAGWNRFKGL